MSMSVDPLPSQAATSGATYAAAVMGEMAEIDKLRELARNDDVPYESRFVAAHDAKLLHCQLERMTRRLKGDG